MTTQQAPLCGLLWLSRISASWADGVDYVIGVGYVIGKGLKLRLRN